MRTSVSLLTFALCLAWAGPAQADLIRPRPIKCPPGSFKYTNHCGSICKPRGCKNDKGCGRKVCRKVPLCIKKGKRHGCGRPRRGPDGKRPMYRYVKVTGSCAKGKKCRHGSRCIKAKRCVRDSAVKKDAPPKTEPNEEAKKEREVGEEAKKKQEAEEAAKKMQKDEEAARKQKDEEAARKKHAAKKEDEEETEQDDEPKPEPEPTKPSGCAVATPPVGGGLLLVLLLGLRRRRLP